MKVNEFIAKAQKNLNENEYNLRRFMRVSCSASDVETAILYAQTIQRCGTWRGQLMQPRGEVEAILRNAKLLDEG